LTESLNIQDIPTVSGTSGYTVQWYPVRAIVMLMFDLTNPYLSQLNFRKAIAYAVNYSALLQEIYGNYSLPARGPLPSAAVGFNNSLPYPQQNITLAKQYLAKTNYTGQTLTAVWNDYGWKLQTLEAVQSDLSHIGINISIVKLTYPALFSALEKPGSYDIYLFFNTMVVDEPFSYLQEVYNGTFISSPASNPPVQEQQLLSQALQNANNNAAYLQDLQKIQAVAVEQQYQVYLYDLNDNKAYSTSAVSSYINFPGDHPDVPDYYAMSPG